MNFLKTDKFNKFFMILLFFNIILLGVIIFILNDYKGLNNIAIDDVFCFFIFIFTIVIFINIPVSTTIAIAINLIGYLRKKNKLTTRANVDIIKLEKKHTRKIIQGCIFIITSIMLFSTTYSLGLNSIWIWILLIILSSIPVTIACYFCCVTIPIAIAEIVIRVKSIYPMLFVFAASLAFIYRYCYLLAVIFGVACHQSKLNFSLDSLSAVNISFEFSFIIGVGVVLFVAALKLIIRLIRKMIYKK